MYFNKLLPILAHRQRTQSGARQILDRFSFEAFIATSVNLSGIITIEDHFDLSIRTIYETALTIDTTLETDAIITQVRDIDMYLVEAEEVEING